MKKNTCLYLPLIEIMVSKLSLKRNCVHTCIVVYVDLTSYINVHLFLGKKNYLPPTHLVYGFGLLFKVNIM